MTDNFSISDSKIPNVFLSLLPIVSLLILLSLSIYNFGDNCSAGPNQIALFSATVITFIVAMISGQKYVDVEKGMVKGIGAAIPPCLLLLFVGTLIGIWFLSGTVPTLVYYGVKIIDAQFFYPCVVIVCSLVSMSIGSSWNTAATVGIAFMGISKALDLDPAITCGAVISGSYFGDKLSPLSETTNLASAVGNVNIFAHIRNMLYTTIPSIILAVIGFFIIGNVTIHNVGNLQENSLDTSIAKIFNITIFNLIPLVVLLVMAIKRFPAILTICAGILSGIIVALIFQGDTMGRIFNTDGSVLSNLRLIWITSFDGLTLNTADANLNELLSGGGMNKMLNTVFLILAAMCFGSVMECTGCLKKIMTLMLCITTTATRLVVCTIFTCFGVNIISGEQCMGVILPGRMFIDLYKDKGLSPTLMTRSLEDGATITSVLIPWSTCGVFFSGVLGISTLEYLPYCLFNLINPLLAILIAIFGIKFITKTTTSL